MHVHMFVGFAVWSVGSENIDTRREYGLETRGNTDLMRFSPSVYLKHVYSLKHGFWCG